MAKSTRWLLTFVGNRGVLSTTESVERETYEHVRAMWSKFMASDNEMLVIGDCSVNQVDGIELDISEDDIIVRRKP